MRSVIQRGRTLLHDDGSFTFDLRRKPSIFATREEAQAKAAELGLAEGSFVILTSASPNAHSEPSTDRPARPVVTVP